MQRCGTRQGSCLEKLSLIGVAAHKHKNVTFDRQWDRGVLTSASILPSQAIRLIALPFRSRSSGFTQQHIRIESLKIIGTNYWLLAVFVAVRGAKQGICVFACLLASWNISLAHPNTTPFEFSVGQIFREQSEIHAVTRGRGTMDLGSWSPLYQPQRSVKPPPV